MVKTILNSVAPLPLFSAGVITLGIVDVASPVFLGGGSHVVDVITLGNVTVPFSEPELPQSEPVTSLPIGWDGAADATITELGNDVSNGTAFQDALDAVVQTSGIYIIEITAGVRCEGEFILPSDLGTDWLIIRTSAHSTTLPAFGTRVTNNTGMAILASPEQDAKILRSALTGDPSHHVRCIGIEFAADADDVGGSYSFVRMENNAHHIIFDRCYFHAQPEEDIVGGLLLSEVGEFAVIDSRFEHIQVYPGSGIGADSIAIQIHAASGPGLVENNYISSSGENILANGATSARPAPDDEVTYDLTIRGNYVFKPLSWRNALSAPGHSNDGLTAQVKNHIELKEGRRVLIEGNRCENCWPSAGSQRGVSIVIKSDVASTTDVTIRYNWSIGCDEWMLTHGTYGTNRVLFEHNLFTKDATVYSQDQSNQRTMILSEGTTSPGLPNPVFSTSNLTIKNNTYYCARPITNIGVWLDRIYVILYEFTFENNIMAGGEKFQSGAGIGNVACDAACDGYLVDNNLVRYSSAAFGETVNFKNWIYAVDDAALKFTDTSTNLEDVADFVLLSTSPGHPNQTGFANDLGCDTALIIAALNDPATL